MRRDPKSPPDHAPFLFRLVFGRGLLFNRAALLAVHGLRGCHG